jgi:homoprotocatechuate degradation regulator HpaR
VVDAHVSFRKNGGAARRTVIDDSSRFCRIAAARITNILATWSATWRRVGHRRCTEAERMKSSKPELVRRNLPLLLLQGRERVLGRFRPILNAHGYTEQQWRIVRALLDSGPLEPREIGEICRISSPSLAGVLARMDDLGFVVRKRLPHDQRRVRVSLTPRSRALAARMAPSIEVIYRQLEQQLGAEFIERLYRTLDELLETLGPDGGAPGSDPAASPDA